MTTGASVAPTGRCPRCGGVGPVFDPCCSDDLRRVEAWALERGDGDPLLGRVLGGRLVVEGLLAVGSTSGVYRGHDERDGRPAVLKVLRDDGPLGAEALALARHEAGLLEALDRRAGHAPGAVVALLGAGELAIPGGRARASWLALERLGPSVAELVAASVGELDVGFVGGVAQEALAALAWLHDAGVAHGDLKPSHLLRRGDAGGLVLIDLGSAALLDRASSSPRPASPRYAAPERASTGPTVASDLYALGASLGALRPGIDPRSAGPTRDALGAWIATLLDPRAERRPRSAQEAAVALERAVSGAPRGAAGEPRAGRGRRGT